MLRLLSAIVLSRLAALVLRTLATVLALALLALLAWQYCHRSVHSSSGATRRVPEAVLDPTEQPCSPDGSATLRLLIQRLDFRTGTVTVDPILCVPAAVVRALRGNLPRSLGGPQPLVRETQRGPAVSHAFRDDIVLLELGSGLLPTLHMEEIPLRSLVERALSDGVFVRRLRALAVPVTGRPRDYPLDQYSLDVYATAQLDPFVVYHPRGSRHHSDELPLALRAFVAPDLRTLRAGQSHDGRFLISIRLTRPWPTETFVVAMLLIPLLLIAVLARATGSRSAHGTETVVGAAAVLLALLPIRAVLVPDDISALTLVDYVLAFEVSLLALLVVWRETAA